MGTLIRRRPHAVPIPSIALYAGLAYAISWATWIPLAMMAEKVVRGDAWPSHVPGLMSPMPAALLATWLLEGHPGYAIFSRG